MPYTARPLRVFSVDVQKNGGAADGTEPWEVTASAPFGSSDFVESGTGDMAELVGPIYHDRDYTIVFAIVPGFTTPDPVTLTASATPQAFTGNYVGAASGVSVTVDITPVASGATWTMTGPDASMPYDGTNYESLNGLDAGQYTVTFDALGGYNLPSPSVVSTAVLTDGQSETLFGVYTLISGLGTASIEIENAPQTTTWTLFGPSGFEHAGVGDTAIGDLTAGSYYVRWGWVRDYWTPFGYNAEMHPNGVGPNGAWTTDSQDVINTQTTTYTGTYTARSVLAKSELTLGLSIVSDRYYKGADIQSDGMRSLTSHVGWLSKDNPVEWPTVDASTLIRVPSPRAGIQNFWLFWLGIGDVRIRNSGEVAEVFNCNGDTAGQIGIEFQLNMDLADIVDPIQTTFVDIFNINGGDPIRNIEIVHEDYCGAGANKDFRDTTKTFMTEQGRNLTDYVRICRFLEHMNNVNSPDADTEAVWQSGVGWVFDVDAPGRQWDDFQPAYPKTVGQSYQMQIDIANAAGGDLWLTFPTFDDGDVLAQDIIEAVEAPYTGLAGGGLNPANKVYIEYSNEIWNSGSFMQSSFALAAGLKHAGIEPAGAATFGFGDLTGGGMSDPNQLRVRCRYLSYRLWRIRVLYESIIAGDIPGLYPTFADRVQLVVAAWALRGREDGWSYFRERVTSGDQQTSDPISFDIGNPTTPVSDSFHCFATAYYPDFDLPLAPADPADWPQSWIDWLPDWEADMNSRWIPIWTHNADVASLNGLQFITYEGGAWGWNKNGPDQEVYFKAAHRHPIQYEQAYKTWDAVSAIGVEILMEFDSPGLWFNSSGGVWALRQTMNAPLDTSYRWQAYVDWQHMNPKV